MAIDFGLIKHMINHCHDVSLHLDVTRNILRTRSKLHTHVAAGYKTFAIKEAQQY